MGEAIAHGLAAVGRLALMPELALDLMLGTRLVARGYANQTLKLRAQAMAEGFATEWQRATPVPSGEPSVAEVRERLAELSEAERLGQPHPALAVAVRRAAVSMPSATLLGMDPRAGPPRHGPTNALWRAWAKALVRAYAAARAGVILEPGARVAALLHWLPALRAHYALPADGAPLGADDLTLVEQCYAIAHALLVLRDFEAPRLDRSLVPLLDSERAHLLRALPRLRAALGSGAADVSGEILDALKALGVSSRDARVAEASSWLRAEQNADGSWGAGSLAYHSTITALWGLRDAGAGWARLGSASAPRSEHAERLVADGVRALSPDDVAAPDCDAQ